MNPGDVIKAVLFGLASVVGLLFVDAASTVRPLSGPQTAIHKSYPSCGQPHDTEAFLGWPFTVLGSIDDQSCEGNSAIIYEQFYPLGFALNALLGAGVYILSVKIIKSINKGAKK